MNPLDALCAHCDDPLGGHYVTHDGRTKGCAQKDEHWQGGDDNGRWAEALCPCPGFVPKTMANRKHLISLDTTVRAGDEWRVFCTCGWSTPYDPQRLARMDQWINDHLWQNGEA